MGRVLRDEQFFAWISCLGLGEFGIQTAGAFRANAVAEVDVGVVANVLFDRIPFATLVADFLAVSAYREQSPEHFHVGQSLLNFTEQSLSLGGALV